MRLSHALCCLFLFTAMTTINPAAEATPWSFKEEFLTHLTRQVPALLESQDKATGRFGEGIWIVNDQHALYPLAVAWATRSEANPYYQNAEVLAAVMAGGDALIDAQDARGMWVFRKKDNSTWGDIYMPWTYSRWVRAYGLIKDAMPPDRRARWEKALTLGFTGIAGSALERVHNIPAHHAMALYHAGQVMNRPEWCTQAAAFMKRVVAAQDKEGFWSENQGPVVGYNFVYVDALGTYCALSGDKAVLPALERAARFHASFTYPDGSSVETVDERQVYHTGITMPNAGFSFSAEGRGYIRRQWLRNKAKNRPLGADLAASFLLYGQEGDALPTPGEKARHLFTLGGDALIQRAGPWFVCLSAYHAPVPASRWIQDRQNLVSLFHDRTGLILGGGNTKLQPLWSTFTVGDTALLSHKPGDESPNFAPPPGLLHVPDAATLSTTPPALALRYGGADCRVRVDLSEPDKARLLYAVGSLPEQPVAAHLTLLPRMGQDWETASGKTGKLGSEPFRLGPGEAGAWLAHNGWRISLPPGASVVWPVLPHNPYKKDGSAAPQEGRIVVILPFDANVLRQEVTVEVP